MEDSLREEGCRYKYLFDSRTDKEDIAVAIGWSDGLDVHEDSAGREPGHLQEHGCGL